MSFYVTLDEGFFKTPIRGNQFIKIGDAEKSLDNNFRIQFGQKSAEKVGVGFQGK